MSGDSGRKRTAASLAARYGLAALLLLAVFASVPVERAWQALASVSGAPLALAAVALTLSRWIGALRTRTLVRRHGVELTTARLFEISCVSTLYGLALPGSMSGGVVRWYRIGQLQRSHSEAAAAIGFERLVDYTVLVWLGLLAWGWDGDAPRAPQLSWALALSAAALSLLCGLSLSRIPTRVARRIAAGPDSESGWSRRLRGAAVQSLDALPRHRTASTVWTTLALSVGVHLVASVGITALAEALSLGLALGRLGRGI